MNRDRYLHLLRDRRARFHAVLEELALSLDRDEDLLTEVGGGWTLGEHLVHIAAWERRYARVVSREPKLPFRAGPTERRQLQERLLDVLLITNVQQANGLLGLEPMP